MKVTQVAQENKPLFFPLVKQDWVIMSKTLPPSQLKVFYYLRSLCGPYQKSIRLVINKVAEELELNRSTVSRALKQLDAKGLINLDLIEIGARINVPAYDWVGGTSVPCDRTITSCDQAIASCDRLITSPIYIDRAREDLEDSKDPPLTPQVENLEGGKIGEKTAMQDLLASLQDQINTLREAMNTGMGHLSSVTLLPAEKIKVGHGDIEAGDLVGNVEVGHGNIETGDLVGNVQIGHDYIKTGDLIGNVEIGHGNIKTQDLAGNVEVGHGNIQTGNIYPSGLEHIPQTILKKVLDLGIPLDNQVIALLKEVDISQVNGALNHIEDTFETIKSTKAVFLYKAPKMPVERVYVPGRYVPIVVEVPLETPKEFLGFKQQIEQMKAKKQAEKCEKLAKQTKAS